MEDSGVSHQESYEHVQPAARPQTDTHAQRERESLTKARQTLGWQEATVPEVAATAEAQSVGLS